MAQSKGDRPQSREALAALFPVVIELAVNWGEMDAYRHVNNVVYFRYFENARVAYFNHLGWDALEEATGVAPILAATQARFRRALTYPDTIWVGARASSVGADRFTLQHLLVSQALQDVAAEGEGLVVSYDYKKGHKVPLPDILEQRIADLEAGRLA